MEFPQEKSVITDEDFMGPADELASLLDLAVEDVPPEVLMGESLVIRPGITVGPQPRSIRAPESASVLSVWLSTMDRAPLELTLEDSAGRSARLLPRNGPGDGYRRVLISPLVPESLLAGEQWLNGPLIQIKADHSARIILNWS